MRAPSMHTPSDTQGCRLRLQAPAGLARQPNVVSGTDDGSEAKWSYHEHRTTATGGAQRGRAASYARSAHPAPRSRPSPAKSPRMPLSAYRSRAIWACVRNPSRRKRGSGGHQPWRECWSMNPAATAGSAIQRRLRVAASETPTSTTDANHVCRARSRSHSRCRLLSCLATSAFELAQRDNRPTTAAVSRLTLLDVLLGTGMTVAVDMAFLDG